MKRILKVLIGCEESQAVCKEFRRLGHEAFSCDIQDCSGGHPEWHLKMDVLEAVKLKKWDLLILHPPCFRLTNRAQYWNRVYKHTKEKLEAIDFFMKCVNVRCHFIAVENPIGIMSRIYRKPDQIIQPFFFGDPEKKSTCLWLKGLPKLVSTDVVEPDYRISKTGHKTYFVDNCVNKKTRRKLRSKTFPGIAKAMAEQWSEYILNNEKI